MKNNYKNLLLVFIMLAVCTLTLGYAAFGSEMSISNIVAEVRINKDIRVTGVEFVSANNGSTSNLDYDYDSIIGNINLDGDNSAVTLEVSVTNFGNAEMGIYEITGLSDNLIQTVDNYEMKSKLCDSNGNCSLGSTTKFNITIEYDTYDATTINYELRLDFDFREMHTITYDGITNNNYPTSVIDGGNLTFTATSDVPPKIVVFDSNNDRVDYSNYSYINGVFAFNNVTSDISLKYADKVYLKTLSSDTDFKESAYKTIIDSVQFVDYVDTENAVATYDLSEVSGSKEIIGWITADNDLYIGSEFSIYSKSLAYSFNGMSAVQNISFNNLNTSEAISMHSMFKDCMQLESLDLSSFNTSNVTNMVDLFNKAGYSNSSFTLNISSFDTSKVKDFSRTFMNTGYSNTNFTLDVSGLNTVSATDMENMFNSIGYNSNVISLEFGDNFNTSNVTDMNAMFSYTGYNNPNFTLDVSNFNTIKCKDFSGMFTRTGYNSTVFTLDVSNFDTSSATDMRNMFNYCGYSSPIFTLDVSNFETSTVTDMSNMFNSTGYNSTVFELNVSNFNTSKVTNMGSMFRNNPHITALDLTNFDTSNVTNMSYMFSNSTNLKSITVSSLWNTDNVTNNVDMFYNCGTSEVTYV